MTKPTKPTSWYAKRYIERFGLHIVPIEPMRKFPRSKDWGNSTLSNPLIAEAFYNDKPDWNLGVALGPSRICALDIDELPSFRIICETLGIDLDDLIKHTPTIQGQAPGLRLEFRVPDGMDLPYQKLNWRPESDPTGEIHRELMTQAKEAKDNGDTEREAELREEAKKHAIYTVFELRSATDGSQKQNVYPPSIHPDTKEPYQWITQPVDDWPVPPQWLLTIWSEFDKIKPQLLAACPWSIPDEIYKPQTRQRTAPQYNGSGGYQRVVQEYNRAYDIEQALSNYGYQRIGKRYLAPSSSTRLPGVVLFNDNRAWIHHASDPLCSDDSGHPVSPFDLYCYYENGGDFRRAVASASSLLGIRTDAPRAQAQQIIDQETGEVFFAPIMETAPDLDEIPLEAYSPHDGPDDDDDSAFGGLPAAPYEPDSVPHPVAAAPVQPKFVDYMTPLPWTNDKGKPLNHHENLADLAKRLGVNLRYNVIKKSSEILVPGQKFSIDNRENATLAWLKSMCSMFNFPIGNIDSFVTLLCDQNQYNPVATWILSKPWDGVSRIQDLLDTITTSGNVDLKNALIRRWLISAVAAAFSNNGVSTRGVLVLQGAQGLGKTSWLRSLAPESLEVIADGLTLKPDDKDSVKICVSNWIVELGELDATFKKSDIAQLKSFITKTHDVIRLAYAPKESTFARRTVLFGSVNQTEFLNDPTGNTRFWTIACEDINYDHGLDMQQVWAELYLNFQAGEGYHLTSAETALLNESNDEHTSVEPVEQRLLKELPWDDPESSWEWQQALDILIACGIDKPTVGECRTASSYIRSRNGNRSKRMGGKRLVFAPKRPVYYGGNY